MLTRTRIRRRFEKQDNYASFGTSTDLRSGEPIKRKNFLTTSRKSKRLAGHRHASAYFGIIRLEIGDELAKGDEQEEFIQAALDMEKSVESAIAENSLNPANIEAAIRKALLPRLFGLTGLDKAKVITEKVVEVTRIGLARGSGVKP